MSNYKDKSHTVSGSFFVRTYLNLGDSKRFGLFNEARVTYGYGQSNVEDGTGDELKGTHQIKQNLNFGVAPGITCFINDYVAVEAAIDVLGWTSNGMTRKPTRWRQASAPIAGRTLKSTCCQSI